MQLIVINYLVSKQISSTKSLFVLLNMQHWSSDNYGDNKYIMIFHIGT